ncbi:MAG: hypothetical protein Q7T52_08500, partial [Nocardioides sp.]|nr:hypothetical protein [Nocardioides sp.]
MPTTRQLTDPALAAVAAADEWARQAEVAKLLATLDWATTHEATGPATEPGTPGLQLGGPGCPWISEYDTWDLACTLGLSAGSVTHYLGNALELRYRLPLLWQRVLDLEVPLWRAVRIAERTQCLPLEGAAQVDH